MSKSVESETFDRNSERLSLESAISFWSSIKSLIPFNNSWTFSTLDTPSGDSSFFKSSMILTLFNNSLVNSNAFNFSFSILKTSIRSTKFWSLSEIELEKGIFNSLCLLIVS